MLWNDSQETWKDFLKRCYSSWTNKAGISKETAADEVVRIHNEHGAQYKTGLHFNPASVTEANRLKANCATLTRYMDREELFELFPYILAAMGDEQKLAFATQYLMPAGLVVNLASEANHDEFNYEAAADVQSAACDAMKALTAAALNPTPENLAIAEREADRAHERFKRTKGLIAAARNACKKTTAVIGKAFHRKDKVTA